MVFHRDMDWPLYWRLPPRAELSSDRLLDAFLDYVSYRDLELYPAQEEAILALFGERNVILNTPTGSGKSLVASALHFHALAHGRKSYYTCPIKALVNEKFRDLGAQFGPDQVGLITGDGSVNARAPIICCTAEILANVAAREGENADIGDVVMDEFHYYADKQRGTAWQIPLLALPQVRFLLMSATLGEVDFFGHALTKLTGRETEIVKSNDRPVPLEFSYRETPLHETVNDLITTGQAPIYLVNFSQREAADEAQNLTSVNFATKEEKKAISEALSGTKFQSPYGREVEKYLRHGIGLHHAGLLPKYRTLVERLAQGGLLKVVSGTDTLGVGVNVPIRTVLFTKLCKYDGEKTAILSAREFHQISGRAGRRGFDTRGEVVAQAPAHVIENLRLKAKAGGDAKKLRKIVPRTPPPHGFVMWTKDTFNKLINSAPEALISRFQISHALLLNVLSRTDGPQALRKMIRDSHGPAGSKTMLRRQAFQLFRSLVDRKIIEILPDRRLRVNMNLQADFSLNQTLSLYLVDTVKVLDPLAPDYALDVLTLVESILESPELILRKQLDRVKDEKMAEMKANGVEYDERIEELEKLEPPKPRREFIYDTFNAFSEAHPWVGQENIRPKSIAREMFEKYMNFAEYVREYDLQRVEGLLLRYLSDVYKVLSQTVPVEAQNEDVAIIATYFGEMVRQVDSSLLEDWEARRQGSATDAAGASAAETVPGTVHDEKAYLRQVRNSVYAVLRALSRRQFIEVPARTTENLEALTDEYLVSHQALLFDQSARYPHFTQVEKSRDQWRVTQTLVDPEGHNDWVAEFAVPWPPSSAAEVDLELLGVRGL